MTSLHRATCLPWILFIAVAIAPSTVVGQETIPPQLLGQFGGQLFASHNGESINLVDVYNYIIVQVISGRRGEMIAKIGYYSNREYVCTAEMVLEAVQTSYLSNLSGIELRVLEGGNCITAGTRVTFWEEVSGNGRESLWSVDWTDGGYRSNSWVTRDD